MKKHLYLLFVGCATLFVACGEQAVKEEVTEDSTLLSTDLVKNPHGANGVDSASYKNLPTMDFEDTLYNFGDIDDKGKVEHNFKFTNNGNSPLIISSAEGSCGCTVADYPQTPVSPNDTGIIRVVFDAKDKFGHVEKSLTLTTNSRRGVHMLYIKADIITEQ